MKEYWDSLSKEQQRKLAQCVGSTRLFALSVQRIQKAGFSLAKRLEDTTSGVIQKSELRPDIYPKQ